MLTAQQIDLLLKAKDEITDVLDNVNKKLDQTDKQSKKVESAWNSLGTAGKAFIGVVAAAGASVVKFAMAAAEEEQGMVRLQQAVRNTGRTVDDNFVSAMERSIDSMMKTSAFSDSELRDALSTLVSMTGNYEESVRRLTIAQDVARGTGLALNTVARTMGKLNDENIKVFKRYGVVVHEGATETEILAEVQKRFAGQSETFAESATGKWTIFLNRLGDLQETIGTKVLPLFKDLLDIGIEALESLIEWVSKPEIEAGFKAIGVMVAEVLKILGSLIEVVGTRLIPLIGQFAQAIGPRLTSIVLPAIQLVGEAIDKLTIFMQEQVVPRIQAVLVFLDKNWNAVMVGMAAVLVRTVVPALISFLATQAKAALATVIAWAPAILAFTAAATAAYVLFHSWDRVAPDMISLFRHLAATVGGIFDSLGSNIQFIWNGIKLAILSKIKDIMDALSPIFNILPEDWRNTFNDLRNSTYASMQDIHGEMTRLNDHMSAVSQDMSANWNAAGGDIGDVADAVGDSFSNLGSDIQSMLKGATGNMNDMLDSSLDLEGGAKSLTTALGPLGEGFDDVGEKAGKAGDKIKQTTEDIKKLFEQAMQQAQTQSNVVVDTANAAKERAERIAEVRRGEMEDLQGITDPAEIHRIRLAAETAIQNINHEIDQRQYGAGTSAGYTTVRPGAAPGEIIPPGSIPTSQIVEIMGKYVGSVALGQQPKFWVMGSDGNPVPIFHNGGTMPWTGMAYLERGEHVIPADHGDIGGGAPFIYNQNAPVYGFDDFQDEVLFALKEGKRRGALRGIVDFAAR